MTGRKKIILASSSPRRKELLKTLLRNFNLTFEVVPSNINEYLPQSSRSPGSLVIKFAEIKAYAVAEKIDGVVIAADTIVVCEGKILGKPVSKADAKRMLTLLSNNNHYVFTGIVIMDNMIERIYRSYEKTRVIFRKISKKEMDYYIKSASPFDKAGGYGIQDDFGSTFVTGIQGDFFNVVGLPIVKTYFGLKEVLGLEI